jgi:hypothetical protein
VDKTFTKAPAVASGLHRAWNRADMVMNSSVTPPTETGS